VAALLAREPELLLAGLATLQALRHLKGIMAATARLPHLAAVAMEPHRQLAVAA